MALCHSRSSAALSPPNDALRQDVAEVLYTSGKVYQDTSVSMRRVECDSQVRSLSHISNSHHAHPLCAKHTLTIGTKPAPQHPCGVVSVATRAVSNPDPPSPRQHAAARSQVEQIDDAGRTRTSTYLGGAWEGWSLYGLRLGCGHRSRRTVPG